MGAQRRPCKADRIEEEDRQGEGRKNARRGDRFVACGMLSRVHRSSAMLIAIVLIATPTSNFFSSCSSFVVAFDPFILPPTAPCPHISAFHAAGTAGFAPLLVTVVGGSGLWVLGSGSKGRGGREGGGEREEGEGRGGGGGGIAFRVFQRGSMELLLVLFA